MLMKINKLLLMIVVTLFLAASACTVRNGIIHRPETIECVQHPKLPLLVTELKQLTQRISGLFSTMLSFERGSSKRETIEQEYEALCQRHEQILDEIIGIGPIVIPCVLGLVNDDSNQITIRVDGVIVLGQVTKDQNNEVVILSLLEKLPFTEREDSIAVMGALLNIGKPAIPYVIAQLNSESTNKRVWAFELLKLMTTQTFDFYDPRNSDEAVRQQAINTIRGWWEQNESTWQRPKYKE